MNTEKQIINILLDDILDFHQQLTDRYRMESGIHDMNLLQSAVNSPFKVLQVKIYIQQYLIKLLDFVMD